MLKIQIISDSLGNTAKDVVKATLSQFDENDVLYEVVRNPFVTTKEEIIQIIDKMSSGKDIVVQTLVDKALAEFSRDYASRHDIYVLDILSEFLSVLENRFQRPAKNKPGIIRRTNEDYFERIRAIEFTVKYDDGKDVSGLKEADLVLIGVSRTSKTPLSMYLANKNIKVMNIPLVPEITLPKELYEIDSRKIVGLTTSIEQLNSIRTQRLKTLGVVYDNQYSDELRIFEELEYAHTIMKKLKCPIINVENRAIEETAEIILDLIRTNGLKTINI
ncbi:pyruvate, phosphate dikinase/phosphoenolpyruvate synthase regulator [Granulicatella sp. zg-ZJ]|uniref:pyruvate, water dikinase regulatory protein n=1 Tax=Granulicatella sp. zg-ZJ TaxID=2678504 RepID=UPI0013D391D7|nr:pyruvate, water dikinase regulatory protein [Granulicatella sp. zg-ZJ]MBS4749733.1 kinase/pyrophosphorylase [Carnobacteriaceae bacterium zg-ZUI78]NEW63227.1 pyruvate, phosphate dikinase/phosphoenolpyruvate synthase regulator [Granulicatella sp. zg-ZJ]